MAGKIDMIVTKSISRFARNTLDYRGIQIRHKRRCEKIIVFGIHLAAMQGVFLLFDNIVN